MYVNAQNSGLPISNYQNMEGNLFFNEKINTNQMLWPSQNPQNSNVNNSQKMNPNGSTKKSKINKCRNPINTLIKENDLKKESNKNYQNNINESNNINLSTNNNSYSDNKMAFFNINTKKELEKASLNNVKSNIFDLDMSTNKMLQQNQDKNIQSTLSDISTENFLNNNIQWKNQLDIKGNNNNLQENKNIDGINTREFLEKNKIINVDFTNQNLNVNQMANQQNNAYNNFNSGVGMNYPMMCNNFNMYIINK